MKKKTFKPRMFAILLTYYMPETKAQWKIKLYYILVGLTSHMSLMIGASSCAIRL